MIKWDKPLHVYINNLEPWLQKKWYDASVDKTYGDMVFVYVPEIFKMFVFGKDGRYISGVYNSHRKAKIRNKRGKRP